MCGFYCNDVIILLNMNNKERNSLATTISNGGKILLCLTLMVAFVVYTAQLSQAEPSAQVSDSEQPTKNGLYYFVTHFTDEGLLENFIRRRKNEVLKSQNELSKSVEKQEAETSNIDANQIDVVQNDEQISISQKIERDKLSVAKLSQQPAVISGWVYAGAKSKSTGEWLTQYINLQGGQIEFNSQYTSNFSLNVRETPPSNSTGTWKKGKVIGGLQPGTSFSISEIKEIPGTNNRSLYWVQISQVL